MKSLQIVGNSSFGGATTLLIHWCEFLTNRGDHVDVLTTDATTIEAMNKFSSVGIINDIYIPREINLYDDIRALIKLCKLLSQEKYDVIHTYSATPGFVGRFAGFIKKVPVVLHHQAGWAMNDAKSPFMKLFYELLESFSILISSRSICVSHAIAEQAKEFLLIPKKKLITICNGIKGEEFIVSNQKDNKENLLRELGISDSKTVLVGNTGRLAIQKNNITIIKSIALLKQKYPEKNIILVLAGDGPERNYLQNIVKNLNLTDRVFFLGFRSNISIFLSAIDIFVSPSLWEGLSISIMEAMAAGKPIITSSIPQNIELIKNEYSGIIVPPTSHDQIANNILRIISDRELAENCGQNARKVVLSEFSIDKMFHETYALYLNLLEKYQNIKRHSEKL